MITLDGFTLPTGMVWVDRYAWAAPVQTVRRTIGGRPVINTASTAATRPVTLSSLDDQGWLTKVQVDYVRDLAAVEGAVYNLVIGAETYSVVFRHQDDPALEFTPLIPRSVPLDDDYFTGTIKLMTV